MSRAEAKRTVRGIEGSACVSPNNREGTLMKHLKPQTRRLPVPANGLEPIIDPCMGLRGLQFYKCRKENALSSLWGS